MTAESHGVPYRGLIDGLHRVCLAEGWRGLFRGVDGALPRVMVGSATQLVCYDVSKRWLQCPLLPEGSPSLTVVASAVAATVTVTNMSTLIHPCALITNLTGYL